jgi:hypothetical protein
MTGDGLWASGRIGRSDPRMSKIFTRSSTCGRCVDEQTKPEHTIDRRRLVRAQRAQYKWSRTGGRALGSLDLIGRRRVFGNREEPMNSYNERTSSEADTNSSLRTAVPVLRATIVVGTIVALIASVGAPFKWY